MPLLHVQSLLDLGMFADALEALERLPSDLRGAPAALRIKARCRAGTGDWQGAREVAEMLCHGNELDREEAACCFQALAAEYFKQGRMDPARAMIERSIATRPEQRERILEDVRFMEKFLEEFNPELKSGAA